MSSINLYRDTGPEDYLAAGEKDRRATKAGNTAQSNIAISGYLPATTSATTTTLAQVNPNTLSSTTSGTVTTLAAVTGYTLPFTWPLKGDGSDQTTPARSDFCEWSA